MHQVRPVHQHSSACTFARLGADSPITVTVRNVLVRWTLPFVFDVHSFRLTEVPDDALQFDEVFFRWLRHAPGNLFWRRAQVRPILRHAVEHGRGPPKHRGTFVVQCFVSSFLSFVFIATRSATRSAPFQPPFLQHLLNVLVLTLNADAILVPTDPTTQLGGGRPRANNL